MIENWVAPILSRELNRDSWSADQVGGCIRAHFEALPPLEEARVALLGIAVEAAEAVRRALYPLSFPFKRLQVVDLGNVRKEEPDFWAPLVRELLDSKICPILIGADEDCLAGHFHAQGDNLKDLHGVVVSRRIAVGHADDRRNWAAPLFQSRSKELAQLCFLGVQAHWLPPSLQRQVERRGFEWLSLGALRKNIEEAEPLLRDADFVAFHAAALKGNEMPAVQQPAPGGFLLEEACQLLRYAGLSDKLGSLSLFGYRAERDQNGFSAQGLAQMIWYFLDGFHHRKNDYPVSQNSLIEYVVDFKNHDFQLSFWKSQKSGRWWMEIPKHLSSPPRHALIPCTYEDYLQACNEDLPNRLWKALKRLEK
ncbi:MAG: hypothetical protein D6765_01615 [Bacteroidetes bacterium]|nr:MAG: hypothetical protein D6765_01615 [Bacteroidota bacterium]